MITREKKITIIIPTCNCALFFSETLRHLSEQSDQRFKVMVVDDNSSDQTISICKKYAEKLPINIIKKSSVSAGLPSPDGSEINKGAAASINFAFKKVDTDFFALVDSDAFLESNWVEEMLRILRKRKIVGAPIFALQNAGIIAYVCGLEIEARYNRLKEGLLHHLSTCNLAGRKELIELIKLDETLDYAYDHQLSFQLKKNGIFFFLTKKTFCHHINKGGLVNFFMQQYKIAKYHALLSREMKKEALAGDEISPSYLILQPIFLFISIILLPFSLWASTAFLILVLLLNYYFIFYVAKTYFFYLPVAVALIIIKNLAWIFGAPAGLLAKK